MHVGGVSWLRFCERYEQQWLSKRAPPTIEAWRTVKWFVEEHCPLASIQQANDLWLDRFLDALYAKGVSENTEATYLAKIKAALMWACKKRYLRQMPFITVQWDRKPRSDAVTPKQFMAMLDVIPTVRRKDPPRWRRLLRGQFYTGLRIGELLALSWDDGADLQVVETPRPAIHFRKQRNKQRQIRPLVPEAWEIIADVPVRSGVVFPIAGRDGQMCTKKVVQWIAEIGKEAGAVTNSQTDKHATSHDIRRAFYDWAEGKYGQQVASLILRHADRGCMSGPVRWNTNSSRPTGT